MKYKTITIYLLVCSTAFFSSGCIRKWFAKRRAVDHYVTALSLQSAAFDEDAVMELEKAIRLDHEFTLAFSMLGDLYQKLGQPEQAADSYEKACLMDPWAFSDHLNLGKVYKTLKRFTDAVRVLKRACQLQPDHPEANYALAVSYYELKDYEQAAFFCSRAAELTPDNDEVFTSLGDIYSKTGKNHRSIKAYKQALELQPEQPEIMTRLASVYIQQKRFAPARLILGKVIDLDSKNHKPYVILAYCFLLEGNIKLGLEQESRKSNNIPKAQKHQHQALQLYNEALKYYLHAAEKKPNSHDAHNGLGVTYIMLYRANPDDTQLAHNALESWHRSLEIKPDQPKIKSQLQRFTRELFPSRANNDLTP